MFTYLKLLFFNPRTISELSSRCNDPKKIGFWLYNHIHYVSDIKKHKVSDYWQTWEETFRDRSGDCEDISVLAYEVLKRNKFQPYILSVWGKKDYKIDAHAVCAVKWNNVWYHVSNWGCKQTKAKTLREVADYIYPIYVRVNMKDTEGNILHIPNNI